jgi:hypothetical protein
MFAMVIILMGGLLGRVAHLADAHGSGKSTQAAPTTTRYHVTLATWLHPNPRPHVRG